VDAIVMAAGAGRRLRPFTERWAKPILPVDGRPVIATLLRELASAGVERAFVVTGHLAPQVEALVGDGTAFGLRVAFARQPDVLGSADAVLRALAAGAEPPVLVTAADTVFTDGDVARFARGFEGTAAQAALAVRRGVAPSPEKPGVRVDDGLVARVVDTDGRLRLTSAPLWALGPELAVHLERLPGPPFELAVALQRAVDDGLRVAAVEIGPTRDLTRPLDLVERNFGYLRAYERDLPPVQERT
jgi:NDP-sugar pyrophosphorylase family protein